MKKYIGFDIGGMSVKGGIVDQEGKLLIFDNIPTDSVNMINDLAVFTGKLIKKAGLEKEDIAGVGIGIPGMIDSENGAVIFAGNLDWKNFAIAYDLSATIGLPVKITNDANAAALGEARFGAGKEYSDSILVTLGTGVGGGIVLSNRIVEGNKSAGAELGHMVICDGGEQCTCGRKGCFEAYCSATALIRDTKRAMLAHKDSKMWEIGDIEKVSGKTAFDYKDTDKYAREVVDNYIEKLACGIANIANIFRPHAVMLGGGVCAQGDNLIKPVQKIVDEQIFGTIHGPKCPVIIAKLGNDAGMLGAAALVMKK